MFNIQCSMFNAQVLTYINPFSYPTSLETGPVPLQFCVIKMQRI
jgi:hypothetical protein